jgi:dihydrofolate reductase
MNRKVIAYIACSADGFIAKPGDDLSFLNKMQVEGEDYGHKNFISEVDTVILGNSTYRWIMKQVPEFPHADKETFVITREKKDAVGNLHFYSGDLKQLVSSLKSKFGKNIFVDGGGRTVTELFKLKAIDELYLFTVPILLGQGIRLFQASYPEQELSLIESRNYPTGMTLSVYRVIH